VSGLSGVTFCRIARWSLISSQAQYSCTGATLKENVQVSKTTNDVDGIQQ